MNIKDIAALAETSVATVSRVINNEDNVSDDTRKRVLEVIKTTGYKPNLVGRALRSQRSGKILVLIPAISHPFYSRVLQGVEHRASSRGYDTIVCITHRDPAVELRYLNLLNTRQVDGAISFTAALPEESLLKISGEYPYVLCCARPRSRNISCVCIDHKAAAKDATEYFIRTGHRRIAFINCCTGRTYEAEREQGYKEALAENHIPFCQEYLQHTDYNVTDGYEACKALMALKEPPTAIFCNSDQLAAGACKYLLKSGKMPGKDVDVIGIDGTFLSDMCTPALSTILQPGYDMGKTAFDLLYDRMMDPKSVVKHITMLHTLIQKETTHPLPADHDQS